MANESKSKARFRLSIWTPKRASVLFVLGEPLRSITCDVANVVFHRPDRSGVTCVMSLAELLRTTGTLKRKTLAKDASGGPLVDPYVAVSGYSDVPCDIQPASGTVRMQYMQRQENVTHSVYSETNIPAKSEDIFVSAGRTFQFRGREPLPPGYESDQWPAVTHVEEQLG